MRSHRALVLSLLRNLRSHDIDNNVYDLTEFEEDHPGGAGVLRYFKGKNATEKFHSIPSHDNEHIKKKLLTFLKGTLEK